MQMLVSHFDLRQDVSLDTFQSAWDTFAEVLQQHSPETCCSQVLFREPQSGFDTDGQRKQKYLTTITFPDSGEADRVWAMIETAHKTVGRAHISMVRLTHDAVFTFWSNPEP